MAKQRFRNIKQSKHKEKKGPQSAYTYAKAPHKIKAFLTDAFMLVMPIMYIVFYLVMGSREGFAQNKLMGWLYILAPLVIAQTLFMVKTAQTPGYRAYNLQIIDESSGEKPTSFTILFRNLCAVLSFFSIFGWLMMFFRKDSKTLHDLLSNTAIIHKT
jgi:uncharacterized RDD family membrane protein YckC